VQPAGLPPGFTKVALIAVHAMPPFILLAGNVDPNGRRHVVGSGQFLDGDSCTAWCDLLALARSLVEKSVARVPAGTSKRRPGNRSAKATM